MGEVGWGQPVLPLKRWEWLIEIAEGEIVLVKTKEVAELVQIRGANLLGKDPRVALGEVPKILEVEDDAGRGIGGNRVGFQTAGSLEEAE